VNAHADTDTTETNDAMPPKKRIAPLVTSDAQDDLLVHTYTLPQLIEGARRRSRAHVDQLYRKYGPALLVKIQRKDKTVTAEGVLHEVFLRLPDALENYRDEDKFESFLFTMALNFLIDRKRRQLRRPEEGLPDGVGFKRGSEPRRELERQDLIDRLAVVLAPRPREVWTRHMAGSTNQETAKALGMTPNYVGVMLSRAWELILARAEELQLRHSDIVNSGLSTGDLWPPSRRSST
jgi:RNA polymerase sigma factor (sigma-70 family)